MGFVVRRYIYRYPHNNFPTPLVLALFLAATSLLLCSFFKWFFVVIIMYIQCRSLEMRLNNYSYNFIIILI